MQFAQVQLVVVERKGAWGGGGGGGAVAFPLLNKGILNNCPCPYDVCHTHHLDLRKSTPHSELIAQHN